VLEGRAYITTHLFVLVVLLTGKSTTIFHILNSKMPENGTAIVACVQNKAVDSLAEKLARTNDRLPFIVLGNPESETFRAGSSASEYTLDKLVERDPAVVRAMSKGRSSDERAKVAGKESGKSKAKPEDKQQAGHHDEMRIIRSRSRGAIIARTRVILCTVDTAVALAINTTKCRLGEQADELWPATNNISMVVMDEASTVPEYKLPALALLDFGCFIAVGDHRQLPPFTALRQQLGRFRSTGFFERMIQKGFSVSMLTVQYRMHPIICRYISHAFYSKQLVTDELTAKERKAAAGPRGIVWWDYPDLKAESKVGTSVANELEAAMVSSLLSQDWAEGFLRQGKTILVVSFYKAQTQLLRDAVRRLSAALPPDLAAGIRVGTVDSSQGSEADAVVVSSVRCNPGRVAGFVADRQRLCVAASRARQCLHVVGSSRTLKGGRGRSCWALLYDLAEKRGGLSQRTGGEAEAQASKRASAQAAKLRPRRPRRPASKHAGKQAGGKASMLAGNQTIKQGGGIENASKQAGRRSRKQAGKQASMQAGPRCPRSGGSDAGLGDLAAKMERLALRLTVVGSGKGSTQLETAPGP
jgi:hypothetical protein